LFKTVENKIAVYGMWAKDHDFVTHGLNLFTKDFIKKQLNPQIPVIDHGPSGPYTNVIGLNLKQLRENNLIQKYIEKVKESNCIYIYRWGDLPLWGEVLYYFCDRSMYINNNKIKYYHGSHNIYVGGNNRKVSMNWF
jgi:hypothetical protein